MQISSTGSYPTQAMTVPTRAPEATERGSDRDNDGDEAVAAAAAKPLPAPPPGRGGKLDMVA